MQCFEKLFPSRKNGLQVIILGLTKGLFQDQVKYCPDREICIVKRHCISPHSVDLRVSSSLTLEAYSVSSFETCTMVCLHHLANALQSTFNLITLS